METVEFCVVGELLSRGQFEIDRNYMRWPKNPDSEVHNNLALFCEHQENKPVKKLSRAVKLPQLYDSAEKFNTGTLQIEKKDALNNYIFMLKNQTWIVKLFQKQFIILAIKI